MSVVRIRYVIPILLLALQGCYSGEVGEPCSKESDCKEGLRCFEPSGTSHKICTVLCENDTCNGGTCLSTEDGKLCVPKCEQLYNIIVDNDCPADMTCQLLEAGNASTDSAYGCWLSDLCLNTESGATPGLVMDRLEVSQHTKEVELSLYLKNTSNQAYQATKTNIGTLPQGWTLSECWSNYSKNYGDNSSGYCSDPDAAFSINACATFSRASVRIELTSATDLVSGNYSFPITFSDASGHSWAQTVSFTTEAP